MLVGSLLIPVPFGMADSTVALSINDVTLAIGGNAQTVIHVTNLVNLGSFALSVGYDPAVVTPTSVNDKDLNGVNSYINTATHTITLNWYTTGSVTGDKDLALITFTSATQAQAGNTCNLVLTGDLYDNTPLGNPIAHTTQNGVALISGGETTPTLAVDSISVPVNGQASGTLKVENVQNLGSLDVSVVYDPAIVTPLTVTQKDLTGINFYINSNTHTISINWYTTNSLSGTYAIASLAFASTAQAQTGESSPLSVTGNLYDNTPAGNPITHITQGGTIFITGGLGGGTTLSMDNVSIVLGSSAKTYLRLANVNDLGSFEVTIGYLPTVVTPTIIETADLTGLNYYINMTAHTININWYTTTGLTGSYKLAAITFYSSPQATVGSSCTFVVNGQLYDDTPQGTPISHNTQNGVATILQQGGGGSSGGSSSGSSSKNHAPTARFTVSTTSALVKTTISFDASTSSDLDSDTLSYQWDFGDGTTSTGKSVTHMFSEAGIYTVTLTVKDGKGGVNSVTKTLEILKANNPPSNPMVQGTLSGHKNAPISVSVTATDPDNDEIQYTINWGDGTTTITNFTTSGSAVTKTHTWANAGKYTMTVSASDNETTSGTTSSSVLIDAQLVGNIGYLIDLNGDGVFDGFYDYALQKQTSVQEQSDGNYLIDQNGDQQWDTVYDPVAKTMVPYTALASTANTGTNINLFLVIGAISVVVLLVVFVVAYRHSKRSSKK